MVRHKIGPGLADLSTVDQQADIFRLSMFYTHLQAVHYRLGPNAGAVQAIIDTLPLFLTHLLTRI